MYRSEGLLTGVEIMIGNLKLNLKPNSKHNLKHSLIKLKKIKLIKRKPMLRICGISSSSMKEFEFNINEVMNKILGDDEKVSN